MKIQEDTKVKKCGMIALILALCLIFSCAMAEATDKYAVDGEKTVLIDRDDFGLYLTGEYEAKDNCNGIKGNFMFRLKCVIENRSGKVINDVNYNGVINGWSLGSNYSMSNTSGIQPGTKTKTDIWFTTEKTEVTSFEDLESISLTFTVQDENYKEMFTAETGMVHFHADPQPAAEEVKEEVKEAAPEAAVEAVPAETQAAVPAEPVKNETVIIYGSYDTLEVGSKGDAVKQLQKALIEKKCLSGKADGVYGKGTAGGVSKFQESVGLEATGIADNETQKQLFGGLDVLETLMAETWYFNGGDDLILNAMNFSDSTATITQIVYDGNGRHENGKNEFPYVLGEDSIRIVLIDGSETVIPFAASGSKLVLDNHNYLSAAEVDEGLQGYWTQRGGSNLWGVYLEDEHNVYINDGTIKHEWASEGYNLRRGEYYYYGPNKGSYELALGYFATDMAHGAEFGFNVIDGKAALIRYTDVFTSTTKKFPGKNGYKF